MFLLVQLTASDHFDLLHTNFRTRTHLMYTHSTIHVYNYTQCTIYTVYNSKVLMLLYMEQVLPIQNTLILLYDNYMLHNTFYANHAELHLLHNYSCDRSMVVLCNLCIINIYSVVYMTACGACMHRVSLALYSYLTSCITSQRW